MKSRFRKIRKLFWTIEMDYYHRSAVIRKNFQCVKTIIIIIIIIKNKARI